jgi:hypothetical protein
LFLPGNENGLAARHMPKHPGICSGMHQTFAENNGSCLVEKKSDRHYYPDYKCGKNIRFAVAESSWSSHESSTYSIFIKFVLSGLPVVAADIPYFRDMEYLPGLCIGKN